MKKTKTKNNNPKHNNPEHNNSKHKSSNKTSSLWNLTGIFFLFVLLVVLCERGILSDYITGILMVACIAIIMATSLNITVGYLGQIALGDCGFMAIGAYTSALLSKAMAMHSILVGAGLPDTLRFLLAILAGGLLAGVFGILVGIPALRLRGDYLAIITLGFGEIIRVVIQNLKFAGGNGFSQGQAGQALIGINRIASLYVVFWVTVVCVALLYTFIRSKYGRAILAIREDDIAASASGLNTTYYKVIAFTVSAFFAGIAGGIFAHYLGSLNAASFGWLKSTEYVIMVVFGGMGSITGSILAAISLTALPEVLRSFSQYRMLLYSICLVLIMMFKPTGILGTYEFSFTKWLHTIHALVLSIIANIANIANIAKVTATKANAPSNTANTTSTKANVQSNTGNTTPTTGNAPSTTASVTANKANSEITPVSVPETAASLEHEPTTKEV